METGLHTSSQQYLESHHEATKSNIRAQPFTFIDLNETGHSASCTYPGKLPEKPKEPT